MSHKADRTLLAEVAAKTEPIVEKVEVEKAMGVDKATTYWHVGQRDLLAALCAIIDTRGVQAVVNEIPEMLQRYEPDHFLAKRVLKAHHPRHRKAA